MRSAGRITVDYTSMTAVAIIVYGIVVYEPDAVVCLPWMRAKFDQDEETWWRQINGYRPLFPVFNEQGQYIESNLSPEQCSQHLAFKKQWLAANPMPFVVKRFGYDSDYIITSPRYPCHEIEVGVTKFDPSTLEIEDDSFFAAFLSQYLPNYRGPEPNWLLAAKLS